jgi:hypothetical protein
LRKSAPVSPECTRSEQIGNAPIAAAFRLPEFVTAQQTFEVVRAAYNSLMQSMGYDIVPDLDNRGRNPFLYQNRYAGFSGSKAVFHPMSLRLPRDIYEVLHFRLAEEDRGMSKQLIRWVRLGMEAVLQHGAISRASAIVTSTEISADLRAGSVSSRSKFAASAASSRAISLNLTIMRCSSLVAASGAAGFLFSRSI